MKIFLQMRAWQLFLVLVGAHSLMPAATVAQRSIDGYPGVLLAVIRIAILVSTAVFIAWFWALGTSTNRKIPEVIRPSPRVFRLALSYAFAYVLIFWVLSIFRVGVGLYRLSCPLRSLAVVCFLYALYFVARNFVMAERKERVGFYEFVGPLFLIWLYPIGVWFIQPRVNRMFQDQADPQPALEADTS